jgi:hypothetical protein
MRERQVGKSIAACRRRERIERAEERKATKLTDFAGRKQHPIDREHRAPMRRGLAHGVKIGGAMSNRPVTDYQSLEISSGQRICGLTALCLHEERQSRRRGG